MSLWVYDTYIYYFKYRFPRDIWLNYSTNYTEEWRACLLFLVLLDICVEVINTSVTHPKCHLFKPWIPWLHRVNVPENVGVRVRTCNEHLIRKMILKREKMV